MHRMSSNIKGLQCINLHGPIHKFPMSFISMDLAGPYRETEKRNQYDLTVIFMLTS